MTSEIIQFDDFAKLDMRVGKIKKVEEIPGADKLWKLEVDVGKECGGVRTICAGLKEYYSAEELLNKKIIVLVNLAPRKMRGIESQGMLLAASTEGHEKVILLSPEKDIKVGSQVS